jgi:hypothetical protein
MAYLLTSCIFVLLRVQLQRMPMELPKFILGDNTDYEEDIFIVHLDYPRCIINLLNDEVEWLEEPEGSEAELSVAVAELVEDASRFYDREMNRYNED